MIDTTPENLMRETEAAIRYQSKVTRLIREACRRYAGDRFYAERADDPECDNWPENPFFEYIRVTLPKVIFNNPRVHTNSAGQFDEIADSIGHGINRWIRDRNIRDVLVQLATDAFFGFGVAIVTMDPVARDGYGEMLPNVSRLSPGRCFWDPYATSIDKVQYAGHMMVRSKKALLEDPEFDKEAVESLALDETNEQIKAERDHVKGETLERDDVLVYEIWVPDAYAEVEDHPGPSEGFHGTIFTIGIASEGNEATGAVQLRKPRAFYGPACGPYHYFGFYPVPDSPYPLSPVQATYRQAERLAESAKKIDRDINSYKRIAITEGENRELQKNINAAGDNCMVAVKSFSKDQTSEIEIGGTTEASLKHMDISRERYDRAAGMSDALRGAVSGEGTATENAIADQTNSGATAFLQEQFTHQTAKMLDAVGYYLFIDERVSFPLGDEVSEPGSTYQGGLQPGQSPEDYDIVELEIEPYSMPYVSQVLLQKRALESLNFITQMVPMVTQVPQLNWEVLVDMFGDSINYPNMAEKMGFDALLESMRGAPTGMPGEDGSLTGGGATGLSGDGNAALPALQLAQSMGSEMGNAVGVA